MRENGWDSTLSILSFSLSVTCTIINCIEMASILYESMIWIIFQFLKESKKIDEEDPTINTKNNTEWVLGDASHKANLSEIKQMEKFS